MSDASKLLSRADLENIRQGFHRAGYWPGIGSSLRRATITALDALDRLAEAERKLAEAERERNKLREERDQAHNAIRSFRGTSTAGDA